MLQTLPRSMPSLHVCCRGGGYMLCGKFNKANSLNRWTLDAGFGRVTNDSWGSNLLTDLTSFSTALQSASMV